MGEGHGMKKIEALTIDETEEGDILLSQPDIYAESGQVSIILTKDQIPLVIDWLKEYLK